MKNSNYYQQQFNRVKPETEYCPTVKIFANGNGTDTNHISLNAESASELIEYLVENYLNSYQLAEVLERLKKFK